MPFTRRSRNSIVDANYMNALVIACADRGLRSTLAGWLGLSGENPITVYDPLDITITSGIREKSILIVEQGDNDIAHRITELRVHGWSSYIIMICDIVPANDISGDSKDVFFVHYPMDSKEILRTLAHIRR